MPADPAPTDVVDELTPPATSSSLGKGIVWADVLADIAADEMRRRREVETRDLTGVA